MSRTGSRILGIIAIILSVASAVVSVLYFSDVIPGHHMKHGAAFAVIFVIQFLFGLISVRARGRAEEVKPQ
jgi:hypothetical protein